jgi:Tfp pilus assembly pilus retraction ATPase PilT
MARIALDRLLETYHQRQAEVAVHVVGSPPMIWINQGWRVLQTPPLDAADMASIAAEIIGDQQLAPTDGHVAHDFWYGNVAYFHLMAFGYPQATCLVLSHTPMRQDGVARATSP